MQATELARERDNLSSQIMNLRTELAEAKAEVVNVRRSIVEEKQTLESRLDEERRAKERARAAKVGADTEKARPKQASTLVVFLSTTSDPGS